MSRLSGGAQAGFHQPDLECLGCSLEANGLLTLRVKLEEAGDGQGLRVEVEDNGQGIEKENVPKIFEPFFTTKKGVGTGLGLWSAKSLVEKHHGQLLVQAGDGTTRFTVLLPAANTAVSVPEAS
jgi:signal transduction histidine kinase